MNKQEEKNAVLELSKKEAETTAIEDQRKTQFPMFVEAERMFERMAELTKETAFKAFEFFRQRGGEFGKELEDWFRAENEILRPIAIEITESDKNVFVTAAVPGFKPEEIEVSVKDNFLILSGKTEKRDEKADANVVYTDWESNRFLRQLTLPSVVDAEKVTAELKDGILQLTLPKIASQEAKHIAVTAG